MAVLNVRLTYPAVQDVNSGMAVMAINAISVSEVQQPFTSPAGGETGDLRPLERDYSAALEGDPFYL